MCIIYLFQVEVKMEDFLFSLLIMLSVVAFSICLLTLYRRYRMRHYCIPVRDLSKGHPFFMVDIFTTATYCNVDGSRLIHGAQCDTCGICVDDHNMKIANKTIPCKAASKNSEMTHHWVRGNLPSCSECAVCGEECGVELALVDLRCAWCKRTVHDDCAPKTIVCDLGVNQRFIVPPNCIDVKWTGVKGTRQRHLIVKDIVPPTSGMWTPLIVIANRKSGSNEGELLLRHFRGILNPAQVCQYFLL